MRSQPLTISKPKALLLDRDNTLIVDVPYRNSPEGIVPIDGVFEALARLHRDNWLLIVVSNQSGIGRGLITQEQYRTVREEVERLFAAHGAPLHDVLHCPHIPDEGCSCRKPQPGLLLEAMKKHHVHPSRCWMIGDRSSDILAAHRAGCRSIRLTTVVDDPASPDADFVTDRWAKVPAIVSGN